MADPASAASDSRRPSSSSLKRSTAWLTTSRTPNGRWPSASGTPSQLRIPKRSMMPRSRGARIGQGIADPHRSVLRQHGADQPRVSSLAVASHPTRQAADGRELDLPGPGTSKMNPGMLGAGQLQRGIEDALQPRIQV